MTLISYISEEPLSIPHKNLQYMNNLLIFHVMFRYTFDGDR